MKRENRLLVITIVFATIIGIFFGVVLTFIHNLPNISVLEEYKPGLVTKILADDGKVLKEFYEEKRIIVRLEDIPKDFIDAVIATEDKHFYQHKGIDVIGILRATVKNIEAGQIIQGGSTITQQLVKLLFLTPERTFIRKLKEVITAYQIEKKYSKKEILTLYFNNIYFGHGAYGIEAAARVFFNKFPQELNLTECAYLTGFLKAPTHYSPFNYPEKAKKRQEYVLKRMLIEKYITKKQFITAFNFSPQFYTFRIKQEAKNEASYFVEYVREYIKSRYGEEILNRGGFKIYTSLNLNLQRMAVSAVRKGIERIHKEIGKNYEIKGFIKDDPLSVIKNLKEEEEVKGVVINYDAKKIVVDFLREKQEIELFDLKNINPVSLPKLEEVVSIRKISRDEKAKRTIVSIIPLVQASLLVIEPLTGYIKAVVGGYDFNLSPFNRATQSKRQPGSSFKIFTYATAIENGFTPASFIEDSTVTYYNEGGEKQWSPQNYEKKFYGPITLRKALAKSINVPAVKLLEKVGVKEMIKYAHKMGIRSELTCDLSLALGSSIVSNLEMVEAYSTLANYGVHIEPITILKIEDTNGQILEEAYSLKNRVLSSASAYIMINMLQETVRSGTCYIARGLKRPVSAKTGTTNNFSDAWFIGFTPQLVTGVWVGFDKTRSLGRMFTGADAAGSIWTEFMMNALYNKPEENFIIPDEILFVKIDKESGLLATDRCKEDEVIEEVFINGTEPKEYCNLH